MEQTNTTPSPAYDLLETSERLAVDDYVRYAGGPSPKTLLSVEKGHNRFLWDFRTDDVSPDVKNVFIYGSYAGYAVPPGKYKAELNVNGTISETKIIKFQSINNPDNLSY